ncbi:MAG TPA: S8 family serine peptidase, partial [Candidatus Kapabacteria bacterium]
DGCIDNYEGWDVCGNVLPGSEYEPNNNPRPRVDSATHGTHTAGCILATGNNALGIAGVAYGCRLLPIKASGAWVNNVDGGYEGIHYASNHGARITNCSWGGFVTSDDTAFANAFLVEAEAHNNLVVAAAGNNGETNDPSDTNQYQFEYPANGPGVLSVGATDQNDNPAIFSDHGHSVSVWAPGVGILSCDYPGNSSYSQEDGTSFSSPLTAGAAGIIASIHPQWPVGEIAHLLINTVDNVVDTSYRYGYWGRIDLENAIIALTGPILYVQSYACNGTDSLGHPGSVEDLKVVFQNLGGPGQNLTATILPNYGDSVNGVSQIGSLDSNSTFTADFQIWRSGVFSQGFLPVRFFVTDGNKYSDTISISIPLSVIPGFVPDIPGTYGSSISRVSGTTAWASFGLAATTGQVVSANFAQEQGAQWIDTTILNDGANPPYCVTGIDSNTAFFGSGPPGGTAVVISTTDGGSDFNEVDVSTFAAFVNTIHFFDPMNGIFIGDPVSGKWGIGVTSDGGQSWQQMTKPPTAVGTLASWNNSASWVGDNGWFGTNSRQIYRTTNRGQSWASVKTGTHQNGLGVAFADDALHGFACFLPAKSTGDTAIGVSNDGGLSWQTLTTPPVAGLLPGSVQFIPQSNTAILTSDKGVFRTSDFGLTWTPIGLPVSFNADQASISIWRGLNEFVVSINSAVNGVATYIEPAPLDAVSEQNLPSFELEVYPNPMVSSATMTFTLPASDHVRAALFDALGRSILPIVDGNFRAGAHLETFDASHLVTGTYYLHVQTSSGVQQTRVVTVVP